MKIKIQMHQALRVGRAGPRLTVHRSFSDQNSSEKKEQGPATIRTLSPENQRFRYFSTMNSEAHFDTDFNTYKKLPRRGMNDQSDHKNRS